MLGSPHSAGDSELRDQTPPQRLPAQVHATARTFRVFVTVDVREPRDPSRLPLRSNRLMFVFVRPPLPGSCEGEGDGGGAASAACSSTAGGVMPETYTQLLMHCEAARRWEVEGPSDAEADSVFSE
jgi:hypothetical protein